MGKHRAQHNMARGQGDGVTAPTEKPQTPHFDAQPYLRRDKENKTTAKCRKGGKGARRTDAAGVAACPISPPEREREGESPSPGSWLSRAMRGWPGLPMVMAMVGARRQTTSGRGQCIEPFVSAMRSSR